MQPSKTLNFNYNVFSTAFRNNSILITVLLTPVLWFFLMYNSAITGILYYILFFLIHYIPYYVSVLIHPVIGSILYFLILLYVLFILPAHLVFTFLNIFNNTGKVDFYENYVILSYDDKNVRLNKHEATVNLIVPNKKNLSCIIKTPETKIEFVSSKQEKKRVSSYEQISLYYVMDEVRDFLYAQDAKEQDNDTDKQ